LINVTVDALSSNESTTLSYNISSYIVSSNASIKALGMKKFTTLMENYKPEKVTNIMVDWAEEFNEEMQKIVLNLIVFWKPARDRTCTVEIIYHDDDDSDLYSVKIPIWSLYKYEITDLDYDKCYNLDIRGVNSHSESLFSETNWRRFYSPSCVSDLCQSLAPIDGLDANFLPIDEELFNVNVSWTKPPKDPNYYYLEIKEIHANVEGNSSKGVNTFTMNGVR
jgi:hypothetical protein